MCFKNVIGSNLTITVILNSLNFIHESNQTAIFSKPICLYFPFALIFFLTNLFILFILFLAVLGLCCCVRAFSSCSERGLLFVVLRGLLIAVASLVAERGL